MERLFFSKRSMTSLAGLQGELEWNLLRPEAQKKIAVIGISRGAGATFAATTLAFFLQKSKIGEKNRNAGIPVTYVGMRKPEEGESMVYFEAGLDQRFGRNAFSEREDGGRLHLHKGINWSVWRHPRRDEEPGPHVFRPFPEELPGKWVIADSPPLDTLGRYDLVAAVIDPLPASVYAGAKTFEILRDMEAAGLPVLWIVNRDNPEVNHSGMKRFLRLKEYVPLPLLDPRLVYRAQNTCCLPAELMGEDDCSKMLDLAKRAEEMLQGPLPHRP